VQVRLAWDRLEFGDLGVHDGEIAVDALLLKVSFTRHVPKSTPNAAKEAERFTEQLLAILGVRDDRLQLTLILSDESFATLPTSHETLGARDGRHGLFELFERENGANQRGARLRRAIDLHRTAGPSRSDYRHRLGEAFPAEIEEPERRCPDRSGEGGQLEHNDGALV